METQTIAVLSAGAVEPGLVEAAKRFERQGGYRVELAWATTPTIRRRVQAGETFDLLVVPSDSLEELATSGVVIANERVGLGRVGVGVAVRAALPAPVVTDRQAFECALLQADSIVFTLATSGTYVESMLRRIGLYERLLARITRFATGPEMMAHVIHGAGREVCLGAIVELLMFREQGIRFAGALPAALQHATAYEAAPMSASTHPQGAREFVRYLACDEAKKLFAACGVEVD